MRSSQWNRSVNNEPASPLSTATKTGTGLLVHLKPLEKLYGIDIWDDKKIRVGSKWEDEISGAIGGARAIVLLLSADFLASDFIIEHELPRALQAAEKRSAVILPIIPGPSLFKDVGGLGQFQAVNDPSNPLISMTRPEQEETFFASGREYTHCGR